MEGETHLRSSLKRSAFSCLTGLGLLICFAYCPLIRAQGIGDARDGSPDISGVINTYAYLLKMAHRCDDTLFVSGSDGFYAGDLIMIMQMQGAVINGENDAAYGTVLNYGSTGNYEVGELVFASGNVLVLRYALLNNYSVVGNTQVISVPQYKSPRSNGTLTCPKWNGKTGGVLVLNALDTVYMKANIDVTGRGFRGGQHYSAQHIFDIRFDYVAESPDPQFYALKGEGAAGYGIQPYTSGRGAPANAGGGGNIHTTGGGGGGNYGCGGDGGWGYPVDTTGNERLIFGMGGHALSYSTTDNKVFLGGGGGAGHEHFGNGTGGAAGGGLAIIMTDVLNGNGNYLFARGSNSASGGAYGDGVGGAGGGGSVLLSVNAMNTHLNIDISGGTGGSSIAHGFGPGGGGGGGICRITTSLNTDSVYVKLSGGLNGVSGGTYYGGTPGCSGGVMTGLDIDRNTTYPAVNAAFSIVPVYYDDVNVSYASQTVIKCNNQSSGGNGRLWNFGDGAYDTTFNAIHGYDASGAYSIVLIESNGMCADTADRNLSTELELPNVFTPNHDGLNDLFPGMELPERTTVEVYDRWGKLVFNGNDGSTNWDGTYNGQEMPEGTYYFIVHFIDNLLYPVAKTGFTTLLR